MDASCRQSGSAVCSPTTSAGRRSSTNCGPRSGSVPIGRACSSWPKSRCPAPSIRGPASRSSTQIFGSTYNTRRAVGSSLQIVDFPRVLLHQVHILRSQLSMNVDSREALGEPRAVERLRRPRRNERLDRRSGSLWPRAVQRGPSAARVSRLPAAQPAYVIAGAAADRRARRLHHPVPPSRLRREVKLAGSVLTVNEYPLFPRAVEYRGERLALLKQLGFNTVWLRTVPTREFLWEARQLGLWLVCPPPELAGDRPDSAIGPEYEPVLAWNLGHGPDGRDAGGQPPTGRTGTAGRRPLLAPADLRAGQQSAELQPAGQSAADRPPAIGHEPGNARLRHLGPPAAAAGAAGHAGLDHRTDAGGRGSAAAARRAVAGPAAHDDGPRSDPPLVYTAISSGSRGLLFLSDSSLEAQDEQTRQRAATLQLLNLELAVVEPLVAGGTMVATAESSQPLVSGAVLRDDRGADRPADVARSRLAVRGPAGRGQSAACSPCPASPSRATSSSFAAGGWSRCVTTASRAAPA